MGDKYILVENFDNFMNWHNNVRYHESLDNDQKLQNPTRGVLGLIANNMQVHALHGSHGRRNVMNNNIRHNEKRGI